MNRDHFNTGMEPSRVREMTYRLLSVTQDEPSLQVLSTGMVFYALCRALDLDIKQLLTSIERMHRDLDGPFTTHFRALEEYARNEIGRR